MLLFISHLSKTNRNQTKNEKKKQIKNPREIIFQFNSPWSRWIFNPRRFVANLSNPEIYCSRISIFVNANESFIRRFYWWQNRQMSEATLDFTWDSLIGCSKRQQVFENGALQRRTIHWQRCSRTDEWATTEMTSWFVADGFRWANSNGAGFQCVWHCHGQCVYLVVACVCSQPRQGAREGDRSKSDE